MISLDVFAYISFETGSIWMKFARSLAPSRRCVCFPEKIKETKNCFHFLTKLAGPINSKAISDDRGICLAAASVWLQPAGNRKPVCHKPRPWRVIISDGTAAGNLIRNSDMSGMISNQLPPITALRCMGSAPISVLCPGLGAGSEITSCVTDNNYRPQSFFNNNLPLPPRLFTS